ncbi:ATP-grasp domain-containing protein [Corynebacterium liangguodongii]|uniref:Phosphoribosylglycinamide formyltransferase n=1 Tax=Corynebacterium liangguodongii TaxID=2079535 RepID=A0A2S0WG04_9CORY|nr:ATP-grasp domain-containing protein [Corynebacterium liangguodongii]AWB84705.1 phosphoribosylglycinamide formyltransferase [Corynebacterium liangguodongii]PWB99713.1 ATP-grasp domain-containing protein [Corynebacterium liangguodongii]
MESQLNPQVLIIGAGALAEQLETAFRGLGCATKVGPLECAAELRPDLIVNATEEFDPDALREAISRTGAAAVPSLDACRITRNREGIRRTAAEELGLPTMAYEFAKTPEELERCADEVGYPCVVKPSVSTGGLGQTVVHGSEELGGAWNSAREMRPDGSVAVERYVDFDFEVTIVTVRSVDPATGQLATWFCEPIGTRHEAGVLVEAWQPAPLSEAAMDNARSIAARISGKIGVQGVYSIELFVAGDEVYFSDVNPRPSLDGMVTVATQRVNQFELHARAVAGLPIDVTLTTPGAAHFLPAQPFDRDALARALAVEETGVQFLEDAVVIRSTAETVEEARGRAEAAARDLTA